MSDDLTPKFYDRLVSSALVVALLPYYRSKASIFTAGTVPGDAELPWIRTAGYALTGGLVTDSLAGIVYARDIEISDKINESAALIDLLAEEVIRLFTWDSLTVEGFEGFYAQAKKGTERSDSEAQIRVVRVFLYDSLQLSSSQIGFEDYEVPDESADGSRVSFSTSREYLSSSLQVWVNGYEQKPGVDFVVNADLLGYTFIVAPATGADVWHKYRYSR